MTGEQFRCERCTMTFDVVAGFSGREGEVTLCSERGCGRRFQHCRTQHAGPAQTRALVRVLRGDGDRDPQRHYAPHTGKWP